MNAMRSLKERVCQANLALVDHGLVICTWGNVSARDPDTGLVAIKPSGVGYDVLTPETIVIATLDGKVVEGDLRPSSDLLTHLEIYRHFEGVHGVAHTHSSAATAFAQAHRPLPCLGTTHADHFYGTVPVTRAMTADETGSDYERNTGLLIAETMADTDPLRMPAVLVASHGPFTWGPSPEAAVMNSVVLEAVAAMAIGTASLGEFQAIPAHLLDRHFLRKHGPGAYYGQKGEPEGR